jgi:hypothetical protein
MCKFYNPTAKRPSTIIIIAIAAGVAAGVAAGIAIVITTLIVVAGNCVCNKAVAPRTEIKY